MTDRERAIKYRKEARRYKRKYGELIRAVENIKAEIKAYKDSVDKAISEDELKREGMKLAYQDSINIIDKHTEDNDGG